MPPIDGPRPPLVLVVDDERDLADLYSGWLSDGYTVRTAYSGEDALDRLDDVVDVVLLDRRMPDLSGSEVLEAVRDRGLECRVAMVTAIEPDYDIIEMGFDDYVTKPVTSERLREVVESLLARRQYDDRILDWFSLLSKRQVLEAEKSDAELATHEEYARLVRRADELRDELDERVQAFDSDDVRAAFLTMVDRKPPEPLAGDPDDRSGTDQPPTDDT